MIYKWPVYIAHLLNGVLIKNLVVLSFMALSLSVSAADLLTFFRHSGFGPRPTSTKLSINDKGSIVKVTQSMREITRETIGKLSAKAVQSLKDKIETIADDAKLIDPSPKAPRCMDAPSSTIFINKGGKEITLMLRASCHTSTVDSLGAEQLINIISGPETL